VGVPADPETVTATLRPCVVLMLELAGVTVTVGVATAWVTVSEAEPAALRYFDVLALSGVKVAVSVSVPTASEPAAIVTVAVPELRAVEEEL
jgi:hypothetical protein